MADDVSIRILQDRVTALEQGGGGVSFAAVQTALAAASSDVGFNGFALTQVQAINGCQIGADNVSQNTAVGLGMLASVTTADNDVAVGWQALQACTSGSDNVGIGWNALLDLTTASDCVAVGSGAGRNVTTGSGNVAIGPGALGLETTGAENVAVGFGALGNQDGQTGSVAVGTRALQNYSAAGEGSVAIGFEALLAATTGLGNTACGFQALTACDGTANTAIGAGAGASITTGTGNTCLGAGAGFDLTTEGSRLEIAVGGPVLIAGDASVPDTFSLCFGQTTGWQAAHAENAVTYTIAKDGGDARPLQVWTTGVTGSGSDAASTRVHVGGRDPNGNVTAPAGSLYVRVSGATSNLYVNTDDGTTWAGMV